MIRQAPWTIGLSTLILTLATSWAVYQGFKENLERKNDLIQTLQGKLEAQADPAKPSLPPESNSATVRPLVPSDPFVSAQKEQKQDRSAPESKVNLPGKTVQQQQLHITQTAPGGINSVISGGSPTVNNTVVNSPKIPPRRIPLEHQSKLAEVLAGHRGSVQITAITQDVEAYQLARDWYAVFKAAGWEIQEDRVMLLWVPGEPQSGVVVNIHGATVAPGGSVGAPPESPEGSLFECFHLLGMTSNDLRAQRYPDMPQGRVSLEIHEQPRQ